MFGVLSGDGPLSASVEELRGRLAARGAWPDLQLSMAQLAVGPPSSGAQPHFHPLALNALAFGQKHWMVWPPADAFFYTGSGAQWVREAALLGRRPLQCAQRAGDVLVVPSSWCVARAPTRTRSRTWTCVRG